MSDATIIAVVTIICSAVVTVIQLLTRSEVISLKKTVNEQTIELAGLHQTITMQSAKIYRQEAQKDDLIEKMQKRDKDEPYTANPPYHKP